MVRGSIRVQNFVYARRVTSIRHIYFVWHVPLGRAYGNNKIFFIIRLLYLLH